MWWADKSDHIGTRSGIRSRLEGVMSLLMSGKAVLVIYAYRKMLPSQGSRIGLVTSGPRGRQQLVAGSNEISSHNPGTRHTHSKRGSL